MQKCRKRKATNPEKYIFFHTLLEDELGELSGKKAPDDYAVVGALWLNRLENVLVLPYQCKKKDKKCCSQTRNETKKLHNTSGMLFQVSYQATYRACSTTHGKSKSISMAFSDLSTLVITVLFLLFCVCCHARIYVKVWKLYVKISFKPALCRNWEGCNSMEFVDLFYISQIVGRLQIWLFKQLTLVTKRRYKYPDWVTLAVTNT